MSPCPIKPSLGRIVVEPMTTDEMTSGGIYLPRGKEESANVMVVLAVCDPYFSARDDRDPSPSGPQYKVGDILIVGKYMGLEVQIGRRKYVVIRESDALGTYIPEEESNATDQTQPTLASLPATGEGEPDGAPGFIDPIASGDADGAERSSELSRPSSRR